MGTKQAKGGVARGEGTGGGAKEEGVIGVGTKAGKDQKSAE